MRCPIDGETLVMADRNGVEIDYCPKCRGVWLDRGELDKIIERAAGPATMAAPSIASASSAPVTLTEPGRNAQRQEQPRASKDRDRDDFDDRRYDKRKRRDSFLSELFDF